MSWVAYLMDTMSGQLLDPIDIPNVSWNIDVGDSTLTTTKDKGVGAQDTTGLTLPWDSVPGRTWADKRRAVATLKNSIAWIWRDELTPKNKLGTVKVAGAIGTRRDTSQDTSFSLLSPMNILSQRYVLREGVYGRGTHSTSPDTIRLTGRSYRAIAAEVIRQCTEAKPGGALPIDLNYLDEKGSRTREYEAWNVQNQSGSGILEKLANIENGPDMQFRPYLTDDQTHVRYAFLAGSDSIIYLGENVLHHVSYHPHGGNLQNITVDHLSPIQRVYASGAGQDKAQTTALAENLALVTSRDPWPLLEMTYADADTDNATVLKAHAQAVLEANRHPLIQIQGEVHAGHTDTAGNITLPLATLWPGELFSIDVTGHPALPDGEYHTRLMQMSGDTTDKITLVFDAMRDPET